MPHPPSSLLHTHATPSLLPTPNLLLSISLSIGSGGSGDWNTAAIHRLLPWRDRRTCWGKGLGRRSPWGNRRMVHIGVGVVFILLIKEQCHRGREVDEGMGEVDEGMGEVDEGRGKCTPCFQVLLFSVSVSWAQVGHQVQATCWCPQHSGSQDLLQWELQQLVWQGLRRVYRGGKMAAMWVWCASLLS